MLSARIRWCGIGLVIALGCALLSNWTWPNPGCEIKADNYIGTKMIRQNLREPRVHVTGNETWMTNLALAMMVMDRMEGYPDYMANPHNLRENGMKYTATLDRQFVEDVLNDPTYFRFVFVRDPFSRLLSAWLSKRRRIEGTPATFEEFIKDTTDKVQRGVKVDQHFAPQVSFCGLDEIPFDFIGKFESLNEWGLSLVRAIGVEHLTSSGWKPYPDFFESGKATNGTAFSEATNSSARLREFYSPDLVEMVMVAYAADIERFNYHQFASQLLLGLKATNPEGS